ncbi:TetR/AcrR family transcriptional regulator [Nocardia jinanensis]|uniref:TetR family transcriptional regulator n=1 Tax=Nocardia jinanensis TaxID=382504 RepID=A0A917VPK2_9NOCA|nr:TetR/AcrR family transcriptional regulator [Nocardia jinanensis]GGL05204.1 TetR family transcriptional regulator [Nocardia jinanensis]
MARARGAVQLTVDDWLQAGYTVLAEEGFRALKLDEVCRRLGVTKGSFYHHFPDISAFKTALVTSWGGWRDQEHRQLDALAGEPPRARLIAMMALLTGPRHWTLERAMREWARSDPRAAASVRASDRQARRTVRQAFLDHGCDADTAARRAEWMFAMGIGALHLSNSPRSGRAAVTERAALVDFLLRP